MSRTTTTTPDSRNEITEPKEQKSIDWLDAISKLIIPPAPPQPQNPIAKLKDAFTIEELAETLETSNELVEKAKQILSEITKCDDEGVEEFSNGMRAIWPCLTTGLRNTMRKVDVIGIILRYSNHDSDTQRWASMKADPLLKPSLTNLDSASNFVIMKLFLCILIGYWGDKAELPKLDVAIGRRDAFGFRISLIEYGRKKGEPPPVKRVDTFSYKIKDADDAKNMENVRKWLVSQYGNDKNVDTDALLEDIKSKVLSYVKISLACGIYLGNTAIVDVRVADASKTSVCMQMCAPRSKNNKTS